MGQTEDVKDLFSHLLSRGLSKRQAEVAVCVANHLTSKEIGNSLFITEKTVKFHITQIYRKMGIRKRSLFIAWAQPYLPKDS